MTHRHERTETHDALAQSNAQSQPAGSASDGLVPHTSVSRHDGSQPPSAVSGELAVSPQTSSHTQAVAITSGAGEASSSGLSRPDAMPRQFEPFDWPRPPLWQYDRALAFCPPLSTAFTGCGWPLAHDGHRTALLESRHLPGGPRLDFVPYVWQPAPSLLRRPADVAALELAQSAIVDNVAFYLYERDMFSGMFTSTVSGCLADHATLRWLPTRVISQISGLDLGCSRDTQAAFHALVFHVDFVAISGFAATLALRQYGLRDTPCYVEPGGWQQLHEGPGDLSHGAARLERGLHLLHALATVHWYELHGHIERLRRELECRRRSAVAALLRVGYPCHSRLGGGVGGKSKLRHYSRMRAVAAWPP